ncbi:MAG: hypothetical protein AB8B72_11260 [Crocinitomicaceae bacterium]
MSKNSKINRKTRTIFLLVIFVVLFSHSFGQDSPDKNYVFSVCDKVANQNSQVGNLNPDSLSSLPIGIRKEIAGTTYIIAIDSAEFTPQGAFFNAYMAVDFPGCEERIAFAAKHIKFNPKGVLGGEQAKLALVSDHRIKMGPNSNLYLPDDGSNFVEWDCNGFTAVNLHGSFLFNKEKLKPVNPADTVVAAEFQVYVTDLHNVIAATTINQFEVEGLDDFEFSVTDAYMDMSDIVNPQSINFPAGYQDVTDVSSLWRGFYLKSFTVKLPEKLNKEGQNDMTVFGSDMIIDDAGLSGVFGATNLFSTQEGSADKWGFSIDLLSVGLTASKLTSGEMQGDLAVPALKNQTLGYEALVSVHPSTKKTKYDFSLGIENDIVKSMDVLKADLTIKKSSALFMSSDQNGKFKPMLVLNGDLTVDYENLKLDKLGFERITFISEAPYFAEGIFSLTSSGTDTNKMAKFPVSLTDLKFGILNTKPALQVGLALNLGDTSATSISAATNVFMKMRIDENQNSGEQDWKFEGFQVNTIALDLQTSAFTFKGLINFRNNDPVYGKGFGGSFELGIPAVFNDKLAMACVFGRVDGYRYWMVDARLPVSINVSPTMQLTSISGGLAYHMSGEKTAAQMISDAKSGTASSNGNPSMNYVPDMDMGIIFKAGVGFKNVVEETLNGDVVFSIAFNANGGLNNVQFIGEAYMLCKRADRLTASEYIKGNVSILYDNQQKIFDLNASLQAQFAGGITGSMWTKLYVSPNLWYFWLGRPDNPATVNVYNLASANAYFMLGQNLLPMPPPPPQVASVFSQISNQRNTADIAAGSGVALGVNFNASFNTQFDITNRLGIYGSGSAGAGFDMTLYKYASSTYCQGGSPGDFGMNYWYLQGQVYAYLGLDFGCTWEKNNGDILTFNIMTANAAMLLQGKLPNPAYVYGAVHLDASFLGGIVNVNVDADIEFGDNCTIIN